MEFSTDTFQRMAGPTAYHDMSQWHYPRVGFGESAGLTGTGTGSRADFDHATYRAP